MMKHLLSAAIAAVTVRLGAAAGTCDDPSKLAANVDLIEAETWEKMITGLGAQKTATQKMAKAYLSIKRAPDDSVSHKNDLSGFISEFNLILGHFQAGTGGYSKPPLTMICEGLEDVMALWPSFEERLKPAATIADYKFEESDDHVFGNLSHYESLLMKKVDAVVQMYITMTRVYKPEIPGETIDLAERQSLLTQSMTKDALFINLGYEVKACLETIHASLNVFETTHQGLLKGITEIELAPLAKRCTMWQMREVTDLWEKFKPDVQYILDTEAASNDGIKAIEQKNTGLLASMNAAVLLFVSDDDTSCEEMIQETLSFDLWANGINEAGRGQMFSQKSTRLLYQIAQPNPANLKVDQDELVDTLAVGLWTLNTLIEGSIVLTVPALPTQILNDQFVEARETWKKFQATLANNAQNLPIEAEIVARVASLREMYWQQMAESIDMYVDEAKHQAPNVHSEVIFIAGRQRSLQCKLASEALAVDLNCRPEHNRALAAGSIALYLQVHWKLLLGEKDAEGNTMIKRTTNICMLDQMLTVIDSYARIRGITGLLMESHKDTSSKADLQSFHEIINAGYGIMNAAVEMYIADGGVCTLNPDPEEWDEVLGEISNLRALTERVAKDFFFTMQGSNTTDGDIYLAGSCQHLSDSLHVLTYGNSARNIPTPPSQPAADKLFAITDAYTELEGFLKQAPDAPADVVLAVATKSEALVQHIEQLMHLYVDDAWEKDKTVLGARLNASGVLSMAVERAQKQAMMLRFSSCAACMAQGAKLGHTITLFDETYNVLLHGNVVTDDEDQTRRLANVTKTTIPPTENVNLVNMLADIRTKWNVLKPRLEAIDVAWKEDQETPSSGDIIQAADLATEVEADTQAADTLYTAASRTTTSIPLDVLTPVPLTGSWDAGRTMRTAARVAEDMINYQQIVMPGFAIRNNFFDDRCDSQEGMRLVLEQSASVTIDYVALGGMGCTEVCASAAFAAASMNMPFLSYECAGRKLSSETDYPGFTRMGTPLVQGMEMLEMLITQFGWTDVAIVSADPLTWRTQVEVYQSGLLSAGIATSYYNSFDATIDETIAMAAAFVADKRRNIMLLGDEGFMRRVVCGTRVAGANLGITWLYEGIMSHQWWAVDDATLIASQPDCTGVAITEAFQGAINFAGLGKALPQEEDLPLDCFDGHTAKSFTELLDQHLTDGYPTAGDADIMVARPHKELQAHSADAVCALAKSMWHILQENPESSDLLDLLRNPSTELYNQFVTYIKEGLAFQGVSGWVNFTGNDKPEAVAMKQVRGEDFLTIGLAFPNGTITMDMNGGLANDSWTAAKADAEDSFPWLVFKILTPLLCICCPALAGCVRHS